MKARTEGTIVFDGLLEGDMPAEPDAESRMRAWVRRAATRRLKFSLDVSGGGFSLLPDDEPIVVEDLDPEPEEKVAEALREFLDVFDPPERTRLFSTLRSSRFGKDEETQTIYALGPTGELETRQRVVEARTAAPLVPVSGRDRARIILLGVGVLVAVFLVSAIFIDYRSLIAHAWTRLTPYDVEGLDVDSEAFRPYFTIVKKALNDRGDVVLLTVKRTDAFPTDDATTERVLAGPAKAPSQRLAVEALVRGYVRCETFNQKGEYRGHVMCRIAPLRERDTAELRVPIPRDQDLGRVVITY
jgi:hypothetical protein